MSEVFKTPPPFVECDKCEGIGEVVDENVSIDPWFYKCEKCEGTGWIPQYYTPEQYRDWIRRENNLPDYELPDDMPVWIYDKKWIGTDMLVYIEYYIGNFCIIRNEAGRPPEDYQL